MKPDLHFAKSTAFYGLSLGIEALTPLALLPVLSRVLTAADYGTWFLFVSAYAFLRPVIGLSLQDSIRMRFFHSDHDSRSEQISAAVGLSALASFACLIWALLFSGPLEIVLGLPASWLWSVVMVAFLHHLFYLLLAVLQFNDFRGDFLKAQTIQLIGTLSASLLLLSLGLSWRGLVLGKMIGLVAALIALKRHLMIAHVASAVLKHRKSLLGFGIAFLPAGLGPVAMPLIVKLATNVLSGLDETAYVGIGALFGTAILLFGAAFTLAWQPIFFRAFAAGDPRELKDSQRLRLYFLAALPLCAVAVFLAGYIALPLLVGAKYQGIAPYIAWSLAAAAAQTFFEQNQALLLGRKQVGASSAAYAITIALTIALTLLLFPYAGALSAIQASVLSFLAGAGFNLYVINRRLLSPITESI